MKKCLVLLLVMAVLSSLTGCGSNAAPAETAAPAATAQPTEAPSPADPLADPAPAAPTEAPKAAAKSPDGVDVDLTLLSSTMIYSEVYAMFSEPERYDGKTVKMNGLFATQEYNGARLYACIVEDATACCAQGLEFELAGEYEYPADYPDAGAEITVIGTFDTYREDGGNGNTYVYIVLRNARLV